jgi:hypothetical protein
MTQSGHRLDVAEFGPKRIATAVLLPSNLAPGAKRADSNRPAFSNPRTSEELAASDHQWSSEKMVTANPQGEKNVERS